jgi:predicted transcriptional regulator
MRQPCEVSTKSIVPAIRALLANELLTTHGLRQREAAVILGITQTAISKYMHHVRGATISIGTEGEIRSQIEKFACQLASGDIEKKTLALRICKLCRLVRRKGIMCKVCKEALETSMDYSTQCELCTEPLE